MAQENKSEPLPVFKYKYKGSIIPFLPPNSSIINDSRLNGDKYYILNEEVKFDFIHGTIIHNEMEYSFELSYHLDGLISNDHTIKVLGRKNTQIYGYDNKEEYIRTLRVGDIVSFQLRTLKGGIQAFNIKAKVNPDKTVKLCFCVFLDCL